MPPKNAPTPEEEAAAKAAADQAAAEQATSDPVKEADDAADEKAADVAEQEDAPAKIAAATDAAKAEADAAAEQGAIADADKNEAKASAAQSETLIDEAKDLLAAAEDDIEKAGEYVEHRIESILHPHGSHDAAMKGLQTDASGSYVHPLQVAKDDIVS